MPDSASQWRGRGREADTLAGGDGAERNRGCGAVEQDAVEGVAWGVRRGAERRSHGGCADEEGGGVGAAVVGGGGCGRGR